MVFWQLCLLSFLGIAAGGFTAAGFFAVITSVGVINRMVDVTKTEKHIFLFEEMIILGVSLGNLTSLFPICLPEFGIAGSVLFSLLSGMFLGLFAICLAENIKALPIFIRRVRLSGGIGVIVFAIAAGKAVGHILYYVCM